MDDYTIRPEEMATVMDELGNGMPWILHRREDGRMVLEQVDWGTSAAHPNPLGAVQEFLDCVEEGDCE